MGWSLATISYLAGLVLLMQPCKDFRYFMSRGIVDADLLASFGDVFRPTRSASMP